MPKPTKTKTMRPKPTPTADREPLHLRAVPIAIIEALDAIAEQLSVERGSRVTRSDVVREALARTAREHPLAPPALARPTLDAPVSTRQARTA